MQCYSESFVPISNEEIVKNKNKNIHAYYKRNDKRWFDLQNVVLETSNAVIEWTNICILAKTKNEMIQSKRLVVKAIDIVTMLDRANRQMNFEQE